MHEKEGEKELVKKEIRASHRNTTLFSIWSAK